MQQIKDILDPKINEYNKHILLFSYQIETEVQGVSLGGSNDRHLQFSSWRGKVGN